MFGSLYGKGGFLEFFLNNGGNNVLLNRGKI